MMDPHQSNSSLSANPINILIVDDTPDNLRLLAKILEAKGYLVRKSLNGSMALQAAYRDPPDLILLDITMPEMDGYTVCEQLKQSSLTAHIPIIFISALDCIEDKVRAFEMGGSDYITKPFQELEVLVRVKNQLLIQQQKQLLLEQNQQLEQEIKERLRAEAEVRQLSLTDELTGLSNRRGFFVLAEQQLKIAQRTETPVCLLFIDLDRLKTVNDSLGHEVGDQFIVNAAMVLKQTFRDADILARLGGDEFVALIPSYLSNPEEIHARLQSSIDRANAESDRPYHISMSVGVHPCLPTEETTLEALLAEADKLMYEQKRAKRMAG